MQEFIDKAKNMIGFENAVRGAEKGRALGLGVLGWHTLLQKKMLPMDSSMQTMMLNSKIFKTIHDRSLEASKQLAKEYGEPEWCKGTGLRNSHRLAVAPTVSNSRISGYVSPGIEPIAANAFADKTAKGVFMYKNP
jgi:ribonucleoside-diphosphate reductase alpha chain